MEFSADGLPVALPDHLIHRAGCTYSGDTINVHHLMRYLIDLGYDDKVLVKDDDKADDDDDDVKNKEG